MAARAAPASVELEIPPGSAYVGVVRLGLSGLARARGLDEDVIDDLMIAVSEACTNAVLAHQQAGMSEPIRIVWAEEPDAVVVEIEDRATRYGAEPPGPQDTGQIRLELSLALLKSLVDECELVPQDGRGTRTRLKIRLRPAVD